MNWQNQKVRQHQILVKDKEREAPRNASLHSEENVRPTRKMNLYKTQSDPGQVCQLPTLAQK